MSCSVLALFSVLLLFLVSVLGCLLLNFLAFDHRGGMFCFLLLVSAFGSLLLDFRIGFCFWVVCFWVFAFGFSGA